jgi:uncharacterized repeat protein (TIGR03803 family)
MFKRLLLSSAFLFAITGISRAQHSPMLWGLTAQGGYDDLGTVFHYDPANNTHYLDHSLVSMSTGANPEKNDMVNGGGGKYYGMTTNGGSNLGGTLFEWDSTTNTYTKKVDFNSANGYFPKGSLLLYGGKYYGMTSLGGANNKGVIFEWNPVTNVYTKKIDLSTALGGNPLASLSLYGVKLYGMASTGGANNKGVIFEWDPNTNVYTKKFDFAAASGVSPNGSMVLLSGKFYGMTYSGGSNNSGVIFEWDPSTNTYTKKIDLAVSTGKNPYGDLTYFGTKFYGLTNLGGANSCGVIFEWDPVTNVYTKKTDFSIASGSYPRGSLSASGSKLYGLTHNGGLNDFGVIFEWTPSTNTYVNKIDMSATNGKMPFGSVTLIGGYFYGMTNQGGTFDQGVLFRWDPSVNAFVKKLDFNSNNNIGSEPDGSLIFYSGKFYGMTNRGGAYNFGVIFEWDPVTNTYAKKMDFDSINGGNPQGALVLNGTKMYGLTSNGGSNGKGVIFEWDPASNVYVKKFDMSAANGSTPYGSMLLYSSKFYGMTNAGGAGGLGVIFEWDPVTNIYTKKVDLTFSNGCNPYGSLAVSGSKLYGMTNYGGTDSLGVIFEWNPATNVYTKKIDLDTLKGGNPYGSLVLNGANFYGLAFRGGDNDLGTVFQWNPTTNVITKKIDFDNVDGSNPYGTLTLSASGKFYGTTAFGGNNNSGILFEWNPTGNVFAKKIDFGGNTGPVYGSFPRMNQLVEATVNQIPVYSSNAASGHLCISTSGTNPFTLTDADNDAITFTIASSNTSLLPLANISVTSLGGNNYQLSYTPVAGQTGNTIITLTANDGFGGVVAYAYTLYVHSLPAVTITPGSSAICAGQQETLIASGASSYAWSGGVVNGTPFVPAGTATYTVNATDVYGCMNNASVTITVNVVTASAGVNDSICFGGTAVLNASPGGAGYTYGWSSASTLDNAAISNPSATPASTTTYTVTVTDMIGCSDTASMTLTVDPQLTVTGLSANTSCNGICDGLISASISGGTPAYTYMWSNGNTTPNLTGLCAGTYTITIVDAFGCLITQSYTISAPPPVDASVTASVTLDSLTANLTTAASYQWIDCDNGGMPVSGATGQLFVPSVAGHFAVIVTDGGSCADTSACYLIVITGIGSAESAEISVYPNPSTGMIYVNAGKGSKGTIEVYNMIGELITKKEITGSESLDLSGQPGGTYLMRLTLKDQVIIKRIELTR